MLEVLTAAVEYGLEELREVGFFASLFHFLISVHLVHILPGTCTDTEKSGWFSLPVPWGK